MRRWLWGDTSAFVVSNGHETARAVPRKASSRPIDVPNTSRHQSRSRQSSKEDLPEHDQHIFQRDEEASFGLDDDLQFFVDDVSPRSEDSSASRAYSRAVCLSFAADQDKAFPPSPLEAKVQQLVADTDGWQSDAHDDDRSQLAALAAHLRNHGLQVEVTAPPKPSAVAPLSTRSINEPFLVVSAAKAPIQHDRSSSDATEPRAFKEQTPEVVIVDAAVRRHLALAPSTPAYERTLLAAVPEIFVGSRGRMGRLIHSLSPAIAANFAAHGMEQPPWRRRSALLHRWAGVDARERALRLQWEDDMRQGAGADQDVAPLSGSSGSSSQPQPQPVVRDDGEVAWPAGMPPHPQGSPRASAGVAVVSILGFEVGSVAVGREPWAGAQPGDFAGSLFRRESQAESDGSSADSEEVIAGLSPVSVFRDGGAGVLEPAKVVLGGF